MNNYGDVKIKFYKELYLKLITKSMLLVLYDSIRFFSIVLKFNLIHKIFC